MFGGSEKKGRGRSEPHQCTPSSTQNTLLHETSNSTTAKLKNPLQGIEPDQLLRNVASFAAEKGLESSLDILQKGALLAQNPHSKDMRLTKEERACTSEEKTHRWRQPFMVYFMTILCAGSAVVQGMDQTATNGAQMFYFQEFGIKDEWIKGLVSGAPYLCCTVIGCWTTRPLNYYFGRRGCIFISCLAAIIAAVWMAVSHSWWNLFLARFFLGIAIGAKSTTTPIYAAECSPAPIRGALVMMWQMWTAFGIMLGFVASVAFMNVTHPTIAGIQWRLMLGSTAFPPIVVCAQVYLCPESPRWYMLKNKYRDAFKSLCRLRNCDLQAARDLHLIHVNLKAEQEIQSGKNLWHEFFTVPRNQRAAIASTFVMFMQQFCGVNVIAYYSSQIFVDAGFSVTNALLFSLGTGIINWLFALPAVFTIDTFGRRNLLLAGYPLMAIMLFFTGFSFLIPETSPARVACIATGIYLFMVIYSPSAAPVPFTYSAEAFPLYVREIGMSFATAVCWGFNFILSLTWPAMVTKVGPTGAFAWYACWNLMATVACWFFLPETKALQLEQLDQVFSISMRDHGRFYADRLIWHWRRITGKDVGPRKPLFELQ